MKYSFFKRSVLSLACDGKRVELGSVFAYQGVVSFPVNITDHLTLLFINIYVAFFFNENLTVESKSIYK
jgi:hypothetical protein